MKTDSEEPDSTMVDKATYLARIELRRKRSNPRSRENGEPPASQPSNVAKNCRLVLESNSAATKPNHSTPNRQTFTLKSKLFCSGQGLDSCGISTVDILRFSPATPYSDQPHPTACLEGRSMSPELRTVENLVLGRTAQGNPTFARSAPEAMNLEADPYAQSVHLSTLKAPPELLHPSEIPLTGTSVYQRARQAVAV